MPPEIDATVGGDEANSYCTLNEADAYHETRLYVDDWTNASEDTKTVALLWATRLLDETIDWNGAPAVPSVQVLQWPRINLVDALGLDIPGTVIPQALKNAEAELARQLIAREPPQNVITGTVEKIVVGPIELDLASDSTTQSAQTRAVVESAYSMVALWGKRKNFGRQSTVPLRRV